MAPNNRTALSLVLSGSLFFAACGGGTPSAASPPAESASDGGAASAASTEGTDAAPAPPSHAAAPAPGAAAEAPSGGSKPDRTPREILELKDTVFFLAFDESDPKKEADASCAKAAGKTPQKTAACLAKAREQIEAEGHRFETDKEGNTWWLVVRRKGNTIVNLHRVRFNYGTQTDNSIVIQPEGKDFGTKPWKKPPGDVKFEVPTEYRIVVHDPTHGKLVYEAKGGIGGK